MHKTDLTKLNQFSKGDNRVWYDASKGDIDFGYSDGQEIEHRLKAILTQATDLSCTSYELKSHITDWPTEYHLTPVRSNLIRALNLKGVKRVLELGCGCGSITRYLGDFEHEDGSKLQVDSVEGSPIRADLAAERCRDLDNVTISTANFNQIEFPEDYYDLVLYVGVTEYAGRFSDGKSDTDALQDLLALAKNASTKDGVVMVAIENRTGMKYVQGANEDHYAKPYIGIHDYAQPAGIRTYTKDEWKDQINIAGFSDSEFIYPFPDYKIPTVFLGEDYVNENPYSFNHLEACRSRDYVEIFEQGSKETLFWEAAAANKTLGEYANSFMILMGNNAENVAGMSSNDFLHLPTYERELAFCTSVAKPKGKVTVERDYILDDADARKALTDQIEHKKITGEGFQRGAMLSVEWSRSLVSYRELTVFEQFLNDYHAFLSEKEQSSDLTIDLLPNNILVNPETKAYHVVDEEWKVKEPLTADFVYFRAVLFFYMTYPDFVEDKVVKVKKLHTLEDWIRYAFTAVNKELSAEQLNSFAQDNAQFQNVISGKKADIDFQEVLAKVPSYTSIHWKTQDETYTADKTVSLAGNGKFERETLVYALPSSVRSLSGIQFSPASHVRAENNAFFRVYSVSVIVKNSIGEKHVLWSLDNEESVANSAQLHELSYDDKGVVTGFYVLADNPCMAWDIPVEFELSADETLLCEIDAIYPLTEHGQALVQRGSEVFGLQAKLAELESSKAYRIGKKVAHVASVTNQLLSVPKRVISKGLNLVQSKKKVVNLTLAKSRFDAGKLPLQSGLTAPLISIIIPFRDEPALLKSCVDNIVESAGYANYEIIAVSNDSVLKNTAKVVSQLESQYSQFRCVSKNILFNFSALVNAGVTESDGEYIVLMNNDVNMQSQAWLAELLSVASIENVATVGGLLKFSDNRIQHLGLHINKDKLPEHSFKGAYLSKPGVQPLLSAPRYVSAVTGALLMVSKSIWDELEGFNEDPFGVAFNDVDFCLRAIELGYSNVLEPSVIGIHIESHSRGYENTVAKVQRFESEQDAFIARHSSFSVNGDPYYAEA